MLINNIAAVLMTLHLCFNLNSITQLFQKPLPTDHCTWSFLESFCVNNFFFLQYLTISWLLSFICKSSLTRTHPPIHLQVKDADEKVWKAFPSQKCQVELFFWGVEVWHLFGAEVTANPKFPQMTAETEGEKNPSIN